MALSRENVWGDLRQDLMIEKKKQHNWRGDEFIHYEVARAMVTQGRILSWSQDHSLCDEHQDGCPNLSRLIPQILERHLLLFIVLVLKQREYLIERLIAGKAGDKSLFDNKAFDEICKVARLSAQEREDLDHGRREIGVVFSDGDIQYLPKDVVVPFFIRRNVGKRGASGEVFQVQLPGQHLPSRSKGIITIAEKHIRPDSGSNKTDWEKLLREVRTLRRRQNHPHIINLLAAYQQEIDESGLPVKTLHLLFPWAEQDLKEWMNERSTPSNVRSLSRKERQDFLYRCIYSLVSGLCYLHSEIEGSIATHHDLKPGNVLWVDGELKIADFGHSHLRSVIEGSRTEGQTEVGTYEYHSPEYWNDDGSRSETKPGRDLDIWAMSCIILEFLVLIVHDWQSGELARFARERHDDQNPNRKRTERYLANDDYSFHNSLEVVRAWRTALYEGRSSDHPLRLTNVLTVVNDMQVARPCDRMSMWESQMDLYMTLKPFDNRIPSLEKDLCVPPRAPQISRPTVSKRADLADTPLHRAVRDNNWSRTIRLWELGWPLSSANHNYEKPLLMMTSSKDPRFRGLPNDVSQMVKAASDGRINDLKQFFGKGLTPLMTDEDGQSALCQAISSFPCLESEHDHLEDEPCRKNSARVMRTIDFLLKSKAKDQLMLPSGSTKYLPLQEAASRGFIEAMQRMLREGVDINGCGGMKHMTPLYLAARGCHLEAVKILVERKAKVRPYPGPSVQQTPFHAVLLSSNDDQPKYEIVKSLLEADDGKDCIDSKITFDGTPLMVAASRGDLRCCEILVRHGASVHATVLDGYGLLHEIARRGWSDFLRQILDQFSLEELEARSHPEYMGSEYVTPRELAKKFKHKLIVHLLDDRRRELKGQESDVSGFLGLPFRLPGIKRKE